MLKNEASNDGDVPTKRAEVPTVGGALMQYLRTNVMMVSMVGMMFGGLMGAGPETRAFIILGALPILLVIGNTCAKQERQKMYDKAVEAQTQAFKTFMKTEVGKALERHRQALERWLSPSSILGSRPSRSRSSLR